MIVVSDPAPTVATMTDDLTDLERAVLTFERQRWLHAGAKDEAVARTFDLTPARYYQLLNGLLDRPAALVYDPPLVNRLRRLRDSRRQQRRAG